MSDSLPDQDREQRWALVIRQHIFLMGGGRDEQPPSCGCGEWQARSLNYNIGHREWAQHLASAVMPLADAEAAGLRERWTRAEAALASQQRAYAEDYGYEHDRGRRLAKLLLKVTRSRIAALRQVTAVVQLCDDAEAGLGIPGKVYTDEIRAALLSADENGTRDE